MRCGGRARANLSLSPCGTSVPNSIRLADEFDHLRQENIFSSGYGRDWLRSMLSRGNLPYRNTLGQNDREIAFSDVQTVLRAFGSEVDAQAAGL